MWAEDAGCRETINAAELDLQRSCAAVSDVSSAQIRLKALCSLPALAGRAADPYRLHPCRQEPAISPVAVQPRNHHLTGVYLTGVHLMGVHFIGMYLMGVHLMGVHLMGIHFIRMHLIGVHLTGMCPMCVYFICATCIS